jgi:hypothetical protein
VLGLFASASNAAVINEIRVDQPGTDNDEYFELFGTAGESLAGWFFLVIGDGAAALGSGVVESVTDLSAFSINSNGYFLAGETTFTLGTPDATFGASGLNFESSDNLTYLLVNGFSGLSGQDLDTNDDGFFDITPWTSVGDSVATINPAQSPSELVYSSSVVGPDGAFHPGHIFRAGDGVGSWSIGPFDPIGGLDTPGFANPVPAPGALAVAVFGALCCSRRRR